jgi:hypothetical protein
MSQTSGMISAFRPAGSHLNTYYQQVMGHQINRKALYAAHCSTATGFCDGGSRQALPGRGDVQRRAMTGSCQAMVRAA